MVRLHLSAAIVLLASWAAAARAADLDKLLLDDTDSVAVVNVKQILAAAPVQKHYKDLLPQLVAANAEVERTLKALGLDPLKDIDRVVLAQGQGSFKEGKQGEKDRFGPLVLLEGRFDPARFQAFAEQAVKVSPQTFRVKIHKAHGVPLYEVILTPALSMFVAVVDRTTVVASPLEEQAIEAVKKATGNARVALKDPQIKKLYETAAATQGIALAASRNMVVTRGGTSTTVNGKTTTKTYQVTLGEQGLESFATDLTIGAKVEAQATFVARDAATAQLLVQGLERLREQLLPAFPAESELAPLHDAVKKAKIVTDKQTVRVEASGGEHLIAVPLVFLMNLTNSR